MAISFGSNLYGDFLATSSIRFSDKDFFAKDREIGAFVRAVTDECSKMRGSNPEAAEQLLNECLRWSDDFEQMPPGLKDIELDGLLENEDSRSLFESVLRSIAEVQGEANGQGRQVAALSNKILKEMSGS